MGSFNDQLRRKIVLTQELKNQLVYEGSHVAPFLMLWYTDETQVGQPASVLSFLGFIPQVDISLFPTLAHVLTDH